MYFHGCKPSLKPSKQTQKPSRFLGKWIELVSWSESASRIFGKLQWHGANHPKELSFLIIFVFPQKEAVWKIGTSTLPPFLFVTFLERCPLVNQRHYGKSPFSMGKVPHFLWPCSIAMLNYQRDHVPLEFRLTSTGEGPEGPLLGAEGSDIRSGIKWLEGWSCSPKHSILWHPVVNGGSDKRSVPGLFPGYSLLSEERVGATKSFPTTY